MENFVITIAREYGSGGRLIAEKLSQKLGVKFYDKELISLTAKETGFDESIIEKARKNKTTSFLYNLCVSANTLPMNDQVFLAYSDVIKKVSAEDSCIIVGRCADYVLRESKNRLSIFVHAPFEKRVERVAQEYGIVSKDLNEEVLKTDKAREAYYNYYTSNKWGKSQNYHICLNSEIGIDECVDIILKAVEGKFGGNK